jgi:hypothetical protein
MSDLASRLIIVLTLSFPGPVTPVYDTVSGQGFRCREFSASLAYGPSKKAGLRIEFAQ